MKIIFCAFILFLAACTTSQKAPTTAPVYPSIPTGEEGTPKIDLYGLQHSLGLDRPSDTLGLAEKSFDTCTAGFGFPSDRDCHKEYFVVIHFRLTCRDSEGTISNILTEADQAPLADRGVKWSLKNLTGNIVTDHDGYGQIEALSPISQKTQRLKLVAGNEFLYIRANEITKIITPRPWCNP
jgi:hypothetical protein